MLSKKEKILLYSSNIWYLGEGMLGPLFAIFADRIGGDILEISWAWATYLILTGILVVFVGRIADKKKIKEKLLVVGYVLNTLFTFGYLFVSVPIHLFFIQAGLGVAAALSIPTWDSLYSKYEDRRHAAYTWGLAMGEASLITGFAIILGGLIVNYFSFKVLFITMGIIQLISTIIIIRILRDIE